MELPEIGKLENLDSPHSKDTYRTVKPPDRCVISYNFQQNNSLNFTHNLLIGMFNDSSKKVSKNQSLSSLENPKNKLFSILLNSKKINRQNGNAIAKVNDSKVVPKRYVNAVSPHKERLESQTDYKRALNSQFQNYKEETTEPKNLEINHQNLTLQNENSYLLTKLPMFDETRQRKLSPYDSKASLKKQRLLTKLKGQDNGQFKKREQNARSQQNSQAKNRKQYQASQSQVQYERRQAELDLFQERNNLSTGKFIKKGPSTFHIKQKENQQKRQFKDKLQKKQISSSNPVSKDLHSNSQFNSPMIYQPNNKAYKYQRQYEGNTFVNQKRNQLSLNQSLQDQENLIRNSLSSDIKKQQLGSQDNIKTQQKIMSKKEIQDQQLRQLEQIIRKEQPQNFKKGHFKVYKQSKQILPFNADIQPLLKGSQNRQLKKSASSKLINGRQLSKAKAADQQNIKALHNKTLKTPIPNQNQIIKRGQHYSLQKDKKANGSIHQVKQSKAKEFSINQFAKANKGQANQTFGLKNTQNSLNDTQKIPEIKKWSSNLQNQKKKLKRNSQKRGNHNNDDKNYQGQQSQSLNTTENADLTQNHVIKGFKIPEIEKNKKSYNSLNRNKSQQTFKNQAKNLTGVVKQVNNSKYKRTDPNQNNNSANLSKKQGLSVSKEKPQNNTGKQKEELSMVRQDRETQKNRLSSDTSRTVKMNNHLQPSRSINQSQNQQQKNFRGKTEQSISKSALKSTVARQRKDKNYYFKNWREAQLQKAKKQTKDTKNRRQSKSILQKKISDDRKSSRLKRKRLSKDSQIDLDAEEEDKFGLRAIKNVTSNKKKASKIKNQTKRLKDKEGNQSKIGEIKQQSEDSIKTNSQENSNQDYQSQDDSIDNKSAQNRPANGLQSIKFQANQHIIGQDCKALQKVSQGVQQIEQLIQENGQLSRIDSIDETMPEQKIAAETQKAASSKQDFRQQEQKLQAMPVCNNQSNLQQLLIATEKVPPNRKALQPILDNVELELQPSEQNIANAHKQGDQGIKRIEQADKKGQQLGVNLPLPKLEFIEPVPAQKILSKAGQQNETDYQEEELDGIGEIPKPQPSKQQYNKAQDFFQFNLKENSKISDTNNLTANVTKYEAIDKNITHYDRAPILSFLYEMPNWFENFKVPFLPSAISHQLFKNTNLIPQIENQTINQAINILISIDPWLIERVFQPYEDKSGKIGVWLYCHGKWTLFLEKKDGNFRKILNNVILKAVELLKVKFELQTTLKLVSGVRIMRLKSNKKRVFGELEFSLKKGHVLKALTSKQSKWGERLFTVGSMEVTKDLENVLQIKQQNETYWVKQQKFKQIFEHFLLICVRKSHFWTNRIIQHKTSHKTVVSLTSTIPAHGSITLFYPATTPSSLMLYKELQSKVLKFMGKIEQKNNQNGNLYFEFRLHGTYSLFLQAPQACLLAIQSTTQLQISQPEYIVSQTLKNSECEYVELANHYKGKGNSRQADRNGKTLERLREKFISLVAKSDL